MHFDDLVGAVANSLNTHYERSHLNFCSVQIISIKNPARIFKRMVRVKLELKIESRGPNSTPRKSFEVCEVDTVGRKAKATLERGAEHTCMHLLRTSYPDFRQLESPNQ